MDPAANANDDPMSDYEKRWDAGLGGWGQKRRVSWGERLGDVKEEARTIRAKRLAKMGANNSTTPAASSSSSSTTVAGAAAAAAGPSPKPLAAPAPKPVVPTKTASPTTSPAPNRTSVSSKTVGASPMDVDKKPVVAGSPVGTSAALKLVSQFLRVSDEDWDHQTIAYVFQVELDVSYIETRTIASLTNLASSTPQPTIAQNKRYTHLPTLLSELQSENLPTKLTPTIIDRILYTRLSLPSNTDPTSAPLFDYLLSSWKRVVEARKRVQSVVEKAGLVKAEDKAGLDERVERRLEVLVKVRELAVSYSGLVIMPGMAESFPQREDILAQGSSYMASKFLKDMYQVEDEIPTEFFEEFIARFDGDGLDEIISPVINSIVANMRSQNISTDYQTPIRALTTLVGYKQIANLLPNLPNFLPPNLTPRSMELLTILGPVFARCAAFPDAEGKLANIYFASSNPFAEEGVQDSDGTWVGARNLGDVKSNQNSLRGIISGVQTNLHNLLMPLIKSGNAGKEGVLNYIATAINLNHARGRMQVDRNTVSGDGFLYNITKVCLKLVDPIMDPRYSKVHLIDPAYLLRPDARLKLGPTPTLMNADNETLESAMKSWIESNPTPTPPNFVTEIFYLTLGSHHYGLLSSIRFYTSFIKDVGELQKEVDRMKQERTRGLWTGAPDGPMKEAVLKRMMTQLDMAIAHKLLMDTPLLDRVGLEHSLGFYNLVMVWLLRVVMQGSGNLKAPVKVGGPDGVQWDRVARGDLQGLPLVPLPEAVPSNFALLPEWIVEDVIEFYLFVCRFKGPVFEMLPRDELMLFSISILNSSNYIKNPHLRSKLVEILFYFTLPLYRLPNGQPTGPRLDLVFGTHPIAKEFLVQGLIKHYVEVESTGVSSAFYDKFNVRYNISQILKSVWTDPNHRQKVIERSKDMEEFSKFVNLLMNDTRYLLDESLEKLAEIHKIQVEMDDVATWNALAQNVRQEREGTLRQYERQAQSYVALGNETVHMFRYLTSDEQIVDPFMASYLVGRLAAMLDYQLAALVGPKCTELKVKNPEKFRFNPKKLLTEIIDIFLHLSHRSEFVQAVSEDGRSYKKEMFYRARDILSRHNLKNHSDLDRLMEFVQKVETCIQNRQDDEEALGDIPDEFLDPLLSTLMEDPVILPTSNMTMDRSTIITQLLSTSIDPFNRMPLTIDMVIPNTELKAKIEAWKAAQRKGTNGSNEDPMEM
ncbi:hypothetical protein HDV05_007123 [Chytridiales sp. JEL 0842]|nr:hypothetical protein HDV05_007123 [Chytridiales sp. JEL 0842]